MAVWKYPITGGRFSLDLPQGARILTVQEQRGQPQMWVLVDPQAEKVKRHFTLVGTGHDFDDLIVTHCGTFQLDTGALVFHVFEVTR